jgi:hypothetical protein
MCWWGEAANGWIGAGREEWVDSLLKEGRDVLQRIVLSGSEI